MINLQKTFAKPIIACIIPVFLTNHHNLFPDAKLVSMTINKQGRSILYNEEMTWNEGSIPRTFSP
jgi:hypothetical protein